jgi:hypothetical protein
MGSQWKDVADLAQIDAANGDGPGPDRPGHLGEHMGVHRGVERIGVVGDDAGRVELVPMLAVDELVGQRHETGHVRQPDHVDQPGLLESPVNAGVPPELGVVVADQVHHPVPLGTGERPQVSDRNTINVSSGSRSRGRHQRPRSRS